MCVFWDGGGGGGGGVIMCLKHFCFFNFSLYKLFLQGFQQSRLDTCTMWEMGGKMLICAEYFYDYEVCT